MSASALSMLVLKMYTITTWLILFLMSFALANSLTEKTMYFHYIIPILEKSELQK